MFDNVKSLVIIEVNTEFGTLCSQKESLNQSSSENIGQAESPLFHYVNNFAAHSFSQPFKLFLNSLSACCICSSRSL